MILQLCMNVIGVSHVKMGTRHCISRQMPRMNISTTVKLTVKLMIVKINGLLKNARKSATRTSARRAKVVRRIVRRHVTIVLNVKALALSFKKKNKSHDDDIKHM